VPEKKTPQLSRDRHERIVDAAIDELAELGPQGATVAGVLRRARVSPGSFYLCFRDMRDLVDHILTLMIRAKVSHLSDLQGVAGEVPVVEYYRAVLTRSLSFAEAHPKFMAIGRHLYLSTDPAFLHQLDLGMSTWRELLAELIRRDQATGLIRPDLEPELTAKLLATLLTHPVIGQLWDQRQPRTSTAALAEQVVSILAHGLTP